MHANINTSTIRRATPTGPPPTPSRELTVQRSQRPALDKEAGVTSVELLLFFIFIVALITLLVVTDIV